MEEKELKENLGRIKDIKIEKRKYSYVHLFYIWFAVWFVDFVTTAVALNLSSLEGKVYETNPLMNWFFSFGLLGWINGFIFTLIWILVMSMFLVYMINKIKDENYKFSLWIGVIVIIVGMETFAIYNNLQWIIYFT